MRQCGRKEEGLSCRPTRGRSEARRRPKRSRVARRTETPRRRVASSFAEVGGLQVGAVASHHVALIAAGVVAAGASNLAMPLLVERGVRKNLERLAPADLERRHADAAHIGTVQPRLGRPGHELTEKDHRCDTPRKVLPLLLLRIGGHRQFQEDEAQQGMSLVALAFRSDDEGRCSSGGDGGVQYDKARNQATRRFGAQRKR